MTNPTQRLSSHLSSRTGTNTGAVPALNVPAAQKPKLLEQVRHAIRIRHFSPQTEQAYVGWIKLFIFLHNKRHPIETAESESGQFISSLATHSRVSASTQNQALNAHLFLYNKVISFLTFALKRIGRPPAPARVERQRRL